MVILIIRAQVLTSAKYDLLEGLVRFIPKSLTNVDLRWKWMSSYLFCLNSYLITCSYSHQFLIWMLTWIYPNLPFVNFLYPNLNPYLKIHIREKYAMRSNYFNVTFTMINDISFSITNEMPKMGEQI